MKMNYSQKSFAYFAKAKKMADILKAVKPEKIILFGSAVRGNVFNGSDIDLCVIKNGNPLELKKSFWGILRKAGYDWEIEPDICVYPSSVYANYLRRGDPFINEIAKGKILYERPL